MATLYLARRVLTPGRYPPADALLAGDDGRVLDLGPRAALRARHPAARTVELDGATITPGLTDAHIHLVEWALARRTVDLRDTPSPEAAADRVAHALAQETGPRWVWGRGWDPHRWDRLPDRHLLDRAAPDRPVLLQSHDMHTLWVNSAALARAGIDARTPDPPGGRIARDEAGEPTGLLYDTAAELVVRCLPPASHTETLDALRDAQTELHRLGITGVHALPGIHRPAPDPLGLLDELRARGQLRLRVLHHLPLATLEHAIRDRIRSGTGDEWIRIGAVKLFLDGALGSRTAWLRQPYEGSSDTGIQVLDPAEFRDTVARAAAAGLAAAVHAIGDAAVALALDVLGQPDLPRTPLPHRIEHAQLCPPERLGDFRRAGIVASVQPAHLITDWRAAERHWGPARCQTAYAYRALQENGATLAFGSDAPVEPADPRLGLYAATTRQDLDGQPPDGWFPTERIHPAHALRHYTAGPARAAADRRQGRLAPGSFADFAAWNADPTAARGAELLELRCTATAVAGRLVWHETGAARPEE